MSHNVKAPFSRFYPIFDGIIIFPVLKTFFLFSIVLILMIVIAFDYVGDVDVDVF